MDEANCKESLRPVKNELKKLKADTSAMSREEKLAHLKETLSAIGARIEVVSSFEKTTDAKEKKRKHLCQFYHCESSSPRHSTDPPFCITGKWASYFWPNKVTSKILRDM
jgi:chromodomain-helicase-DNA-binding protein 1